MIYIVRAGESPYVKIGYAEDVQDRLKMLQCGNHETLRLYRTLEGDRVVEGWFHKRFRHLRHRSEWFIFSPEMLTVTPDPSEIAVKSHEPWAHFWLVDAFGGRQIIADITGVSCNAVTQWRLAGVPALHWHKLVAAASARGIEGVTFETLQSTREMAA